MYSEAFNLLILAVQVLSREIFSSAISDPCGDDVGATTDLLQAKSNYWTPLYLVARFFNDGVEQSIRIRRAIV